MPSLPLSSTISLSPLLSCLELIPFPFIAQRGLQKNANLMIFFPNLKTSSGCLPQQFSNCDPWTSRVRVTWKLVRNVTPFQTYRIRHPGDRAQNPFFLTSPPGDSDSSLRTIDLEDEIQTVFSEAPKTLNLKLSCLNSDLGSTTV